MKGSYAIICLIVSIFVSNNLFGQKIVTFGAEDAQFLSEAKAVVQLKDGKLIVEKFSSGQNEKEEDKIDLKTDDEIQFISGKRVKTIEEFKKLYEAVKTGDEVKLGVKRGDTRFIVSFKKEEMKKGKQQVIKFDGVGGDVKMEGGKIIVGGKKLDLDSLKKAGGGKVIIKK